MHFHCSADKITIIILSLIYTASFIQIVFNSLVLHWTQQKTKIFSLTQKEKHGFCLLGLGNRIKEKERYEKVATHCQEMQRRPLHHWWWNCPQKTDIQRKSRSVKNPGLSTFKKRRSGKSKKISEAKTLILLPLYLCILIGYPHSDKILSLLHSKGSWEQTCNYSGIATKLRADENQSR